MSAFVEKSEPVIVSLDDARRARASSGHAPEIDVIPIDVAGRGRPRRGYFHWAAIAAVAAHLGALAAVYPFAAIPPAGGEGRHLEAVEVSLVPSSVLESRTTKPSENTGGTRAEVSPTEGDIDKPQESKPPEPQPSDVETLTPPAPAMVASDEPLPAPTRPKIAPQSAPVGGATTRTIVEAAPTSAPAGASPGEIDRYALQVRAALARNKPNGIRRKGSVTVAFSIENDGKPSGIRIAASSGARALDRAVADAIARTRFPSPPAGMTPQQRSYAVPFQFR
ncbi:MAG: TonB family protein [Pseudolabrys sp.]